MGRSRLRDCDDILCGRRVLVRGGACEKDLLAPEPLAMILASLIWYKLWPDLQLLAINTYEGSVLLQLEITNL